MEKKVLVIVRDAHDKAYWKPYVRRISKIVDMVELKTLSSCTAHAVMLPVNPTLIIVSTKLYPDAAPHLIERLAELYPDSEFLLAVSSEDPLPPLTPLVRDGIRHLVINPDHGSRRKEKDAASSLISLAIRRIAQRDMVRIVDYLQPGSTMHAVQVTSSDQKETIINTLEASIQGEGDEVEILRQKGALLADEMLENALYDAPRGENGRSLFAKGESRAIPPEENIEFRFGFDGTTLAMEVEDNWGSLSPQIVLEHLARGQEEMLDPDSLGGRGLYIIWQFIDHLHIHINPGRNTILGGQVKLMTADNIFDKKGFHISSGAAR
jgi:hypothetical protein